MKATKAGATIGKALDNFNGEEGTVLALINLSYKAGEGGAAAELQGGSLSLADLKVTNGLTATILTISGDATFQGTLTLAGHLITAGETPTIAAEPAAGTDATVTINGNDTSGTITLHTSAIGPGPIAGTLAKITFNKTYDKAPRIILTPANEQATNLKYYYSSETDNFTLRTANAPETDQTYKYTYWIAQ